VPAKQLRNRLGVALVGLCRLPPHVKGDDIGRLQRIRALSVVKRSPASYLPSGQIPLYGLAALAFMTEQKRKKAQNQDEAQASRKPNQRDASERSQ
jgi:hypothetical protein